MKWHFPPLNGGQELGFHDAGIETFRGDVDASLAREALQNALDAKRPDSGEPVRVKFTLLQLNPSDIPGWKDLPATFKACEEICGSDGEASAFYRNACRALEGKKVPVLCISDYGTTGITGPPEDRASNWYNLIRRTGASFKAGGQGGSFGIGKNAPFAASALRVVLYSTANSGDETLFQGVARLQTHPGGDGQMLQSVGLYGGRDSGPLRDEQIPELFRRDEYGASIFVVGYQSGEDWTRDLTRSILTSFWPAVLAGGLEVEVGGLRIDRKTLDGLMQEDPNFHAAYFYRAAVDEGAKEFNADLKHLGAVRLRLLSGAEKYPNEIAMARQTGMIIYYRPFRSLVRYAGFFHCGNPEGNAKLRKAEPPAHDAWEEDRPSRGANKLLLRELNRWLLDRVKDLRPAIDSSAQSVPDLYKYLPDEAEMEQVELTLGPFGGPPGKTETASVSPAAPPVEIKAIKVSANPPPRGRAPQPDDGEDDIDKGDAAGKKGKKASPKSGAGGSQAPMKVDCRCFLRPGSSSVYRVVAHPQADGRADLILSAVGDDSTTTPLRITSASLLPSGSSLEVRANSIRNVALEAGKKMEVEVALGDDLRYAIEAFAYQNA